MRRKAHPVRSLLFLLAAIAGLIGAVGAWRTLNVGGEAAVQRMDAAERDYLKRLGRLDRGMSREEVEAVLGPADQWTNLGADEEGVWQQVPGAPLARVSVLIDHGAAQRVRWMKLGYFTYHLELPPRGGPGSDDS